MLDPAVEYRPHPKHPGYLIGNDGSVWSCWSRGARHKKSVMTKTWTRLKDSPKQCGHRQINLKGAILRVHTLVLEAFVGPCPLGMECRHFPDRDPANNRLENLCWGTRQENVDDKKAQGTHQEGTKRYNAKLTEQAVAALRADRDADPIFWSYAKLAQKYKIGWSVARRVALRLVWKHVPEAKA